MRLNLHSLQIRLIAIFWFFSGNYAFSQNIMIDDNFEDWQYIVPIYSDPVGDGAFTNIDFRDIKIANTDAYLFIYLETSLELNLQAYNKITLYIDIDNNIGTGLNVNGVGAELIYVLGDRSGTFITDSGPVFLRHAIIGLVTAPTVTGNRFEIAIKRSFLINNQSVELKNNLRISFIDNVFGGDKIPDENGGILYSFINDSVTQLPEFNLQKSHSQYIRMIAYNVERDKLFDPSVRQEYQRIFQALTPDIIGFSEVYNNSSTSCANLIESFLPSSGTQKWYHSGVNPDIRLVSRYPIINTFAIDGNGAFLLDMGNWQMVYIVAHLPCCENEDSRQKEIDNIMSFVRKVRLGQSPFQASQGSPIVIAGDMNFVGLKAQLETLMTGNIVNTFQYGPSFRPDWDETDLDDIRPYTTGLPMAYTWNNPNSSFSPGKLDFMVYTGSVMDCKNAFVLNTAHMNSEDLHRAGLEKTDTDKVSDHLPVIADFTLKGSTSSTSSEDFLENSFAFDIYPNPSSSGVFQLTFKEVLSNDVKLCVYTSTGQKIYDWTIVRGISKFEFSLQNMIPGIYNCVLSAENFTKAKKILFP